MAGDWIKVHRKLVDSPIFAHDGLFRLWCYCLMRANWKESRWIVPGTLSEITIPRGAFITGRESLHSALYGPDYRGETKPASRTIWRWLETLEQMGCISTRTVSNRCTIVTVCKYTTYQQQDEPDVPPTVPPVSSTCPAGVPPVSTEEESKEGKKGKKHTKPVTIDDVEFPPSLDTPEVRKSLASWLDYKRIRGQSYKAAWFVNHLLIEFSPLGPQMFVQAVSTSIGRNYDGIFPPKGNANGSHTASHVGPGQRYRGP